MLSELDLLDRLEIEHGLKKGLLVVRIPHSLLVYPYNLNRTLVTLKILWTWLNEMGFSILSFLRRESGFFVIFFANLLR